MMNFDFERNQASPEWLSYILTKNGFLEKGEVAHVEYKPLNASNSSFFVSLKLGYAKGSQGTKPRQIILKTIKPELVEAEKHAELKFYNLDFDAQKKLPVMTCYGSDICPQTNQYCLLLEDLTITHHQTPYPVPPNRNRCEQAISSLASLHAFWWNHSHFDKLEFVRPSEKGLNQHFQYCASAYSKFVDYLGDRLPDNRRKIFELVFEKAPKVVWDLISPKEKQTLTHGDAHFWNFLFPNHSDNDCVIFDWQWWGIGIAAKDLASMISFQFYPERRQRIEFALLRHYQNELIRRQIDCDWDKLLIDYRMCVIMNLLTPVQWYSYNTPPNLWWNHHEKSFAAFDDLNCLEFLSDNS